MDYDKMKEQAFSNKIHIREALGVRVDAIPEILYLLAKDKAVSVRLSVAKNNAAPHLADRLLAKDKNEKVRYWLARKIAMLAPTFTRKQKNRTWELVHELLNSLIRDAEVNVRFAVSDSLKSTKKAPPDIIRHLAHDESIEVSAPVLEHSPILTDEDLVEIIETSSCTETITAISRRETIKEPVTEAIFATDDRDAIASMLFNSGAEIKEETMDILIERSENIEMWQEPLVKRSDLSDNATPKLANIVSDNLLAEMYQRDDFSSDATGKIHKITKKRAKKSGQNIKEFISSSEKEKPDTTSANNVKQMVQNMTASSISKEDFNKAEIKNVIEKVCSLEKEGLLNEETIIEAIRMDRRFFVTTAFVAKTDITPDNVSKIFDSKNPKAITALALKAGLNANFAVELQKIIGNIDDIDIIEPDPKTNGYSISKAQLETALVLFR